MQDLESSEAFTSEKAEAIKTRVDELEESPRAFSCSRLLSALKKTLEEKIPVPKVPDMPQGEWYRCPIGKSFFYSCIDKLLYSVSEKFVIVP